MRIILLSGGLGKRLWPISSDYRSKQFLRLLDDGNHGLESMVQRFWRQLTKAGLADCALIATGCMQTDILQNQLGQDIKLVVEPERRDTFPAIAFAAAYLVSVEKADLKETVVVLPVDSYVEALFFQQVKELEHVLCTSGADLALIGVQPTYPSKKYGYIVPQKPTGNESWLRVSHFREKPSQDTARELIERQALWNCGVFAFQLEFIIKALEKRGLPTDYSRLKTEYGKMPLTSFDYEVAEKVEKTVVVSYQGQWKDLGTWCALTEELTSPLIGKGFISDDSKNTQLINELDIPVLVLGINNAVIAAGPEGILVSDIAESTKVKDLVSRYNSGRPMFEERRWGWYRVLDYIKYENGQEVLTKRVKIDAGKNFSYQMHHLRSEVWTIIRGEGKVALDGLLYQVKAGDVLQIPTGKKHGLKADTDLEMIEVQTGTVLSEEDILRIHLKWEDIVKCCRMAFPLYA